MTLEDLIGAMWRLYQWFTLKPHVWLGIGMPALLVWSCRKRGRLPTLQELIETMAYAAGMTGGLNLGLQSSRMNASDAGGQAWYLMMGGMVLTAAAIYGLIPLIAGPFLPPRNPPRADPDVPAPRPNGAL